jgi:hypothetical protein
MKYLMAVVVLSLSFNSLAIDLESLKKKATEIFNEVRGGHSVGSKTKSSIVMPTIPNINQDAKDNSVFQKNLPIYKQGNAFYKLSEAEKTKFRLNFLKELYRVTRNFDGSERELAQNLNSLSQGGSREGVYRSIVLGSFYGDLEAKKSQVKLETADFVTRYTKAFLNKTYTRASLMSAGFYSLKRLIVEQSLDTLDVLASNEKAVWSWYAIFSEELAINYAAVWKKNKVRANESREYHYSWAQSVPFQHIKSEVIIKLNLLMNSLN